ncbi:hypothetical protein AX17_002343 [Amanita inopinata Kibby_2008]|nr:hypothetical protein AX17_002343 [Amanita inopinata Kibby_2008]
MVALGASQENPRTRGVTIWKRSLFSEIACLTQGLASSTSDDTGRCCDLSSFGHRLCVSLVFLCTSSSHVLQSYTSCRHVGTGIHHRHWDNPWWSCSVCTRFGLLAHMNFPGDGASILQLRQAH